MWGIYPHSKLADMKLGLGASLQPLHFADSRAVVGVLSSVNQIPYVRGYIGPANSPAGPLSVENYTFPRRETSAPALSGTPSGICWEPLRPIEA